MIPKECKRLAEVDFPIAVVSKHSAREKSIRHGHPSTLHLWWARRPLAACRAMLMALLLPDPCDPLCPEDFKKTARKLLPPLTGDIGSKSEDLRTALLKFIGDFADWDNAAKPLFLEIGRGLVKAAHPEETPLVVDPFAGGGSIPLEALRLGCEAFASDLNPVACLILKVMLEDIPRWGSEKIKVKRQNGEEVEANGLAEALRIVGKEIKEKAEAELKEFYPDDPDGSKPIAYLWARTARCESPNCGAEIPLMRSFWLCKKPNRKRALKYKVKRKNEKSKSSKVEFEIFEPKSDKDVPNGTITRAKATCLCCNTVLPPERVRAQLAEQQGGADVVFDVNGERIGGARMLAVVTLQSGVQGRNYRLPIGHDYKAVWKTQIHLKAILAEWEHSGKKGLCPIPDEPLPPIGTLGFRVQRYGMLQWGDLFTVRQKIALHGLVEHTAKKSISANETAILAIGKLVDLGNALCGWMPGQECPSAVFKLGRVKMGWDFVEGCPFGGSSGSFEKCTENLIAGIIATDTASSKTGQIIQVMAQKSPMPDDSVSAWFTDPPYYDAIPYADLSDFFLVWIKRILPNHPFIRDPYNSNNLLSPKDQEAVQDDARIVNGRSKDANFFDTVMGQAFGEGERVLREDGIGAVVFAHKTTEGWEALLSGMIRGRWTVTASWPIATEMGHRLRARESAALATSVHLVCRSRSSDAPIGDWGAVLRELPKRVGDWMERLQGEGIRGADLVFACIGPALEIFSRYRKVETADGREVTLAEYLEKVWEVVGRMALEQVLGTAEAKARNGAAGTLEEDARLTALFLWTLQSTNGEENNKTGKGEDLEEEENEDDEDEATTKGKTKGFSLVFDVARRFAQPLGIELPKWEGRIIEIKKGIVRLMAVSERAKQLFGEIGVRAAADWIAEDPTKSVQLRLFPKSDQERIPKIRGRKRGRTIQDLPAETASQAGVTTLDRVHAAMLLQAGGQANALRMLISAEQDRGPDFLRLANALSALYPKSSEEKRLLDAMLLAVPR